MPCPGSGDDAASAHPQPISSVHSLSAYALVRRSSFEPKSRVTFPAWSARAPVAPGPPSVTFGGVAPLGLLPFLRLVLAPFAEFVARSQVPGPEINLCLLFRPPARPEAIGQDAEATSGLRASYTHFTISVMLQRSSLQRRDEVPLAQGPNQKGRIRGGSLRQTGKA
jgi:hypothetical protein